MRNFQFNRVMESPPRCPLCFRPMENAYDPVRKINILVCHHDKIAIATTDPLVGSWERKAEKIPCPNCNATMRVFFTSTGYMQSFCPKKGCGCQVKSANPDRLTMPGALTGDGMAQS